MIRKSRVILRFAYYFVKMLGVAPVHYSMYSVFIGGFFVLWREHRIDVIIYLLKVTEQYLRYVVRNKF